MEYATYLGGEHWRTLSRAAKEHYGWKCAVCKLDYRKRDLRLDTHHFAYRVNGKSILGNERLADLCLLCERHHVKGAYSKRQVRRARIVYVVRKGCYGILLLPIRALLFLVTLTPRTWGLASPLPRT